MQKLKKILLASLLVIYLSFCTQPAKPLAAEINNNAESHLTIELVADKSGNLPGTGKLPQTNEIVSFSLAFIGTISLLVGFYLFKKNIPRGGDG